MTDLGDADKIDLLIARFKKELSQSGHGNGKFALETSKELYEIIFRPLLKDLGEVKTVFISPDGNLNLIPFEVLQQPDGKFLIENILLIICLPEGIYWLLTIIRIQGKSAFSWPLILKWI